MDYATAAGTAKAGEDYTAALLARFGRATAEQVVTHIEERMAAPPRRGFRVRFAGLELRSGQARDFALRLVSQSRSRWAWVVRRARPRWAARP